MQANTNAPVYQTNQIFIHSTPEKVWAILTDINNWPNWYPKIAKAKMEETPVQGVAFVWKINGVTIRSQLHTVEVAKSFGWTGATLGATAIHNWFFSPEKEGVWVKVEESMDGWLVALFKRKMNQDLQKDMKTWLDALKIACEKA